MPHVLWRAGALAATTALSLAALAGPAHAGDTPRQELSAAWLAGQLTAGLVHNDQYDFDDYGLSVDSALALMAVGSQPAAVDETRAALEAHVDSYTTGVDWGLPDVYAGASAKLLTFARMAGADPRAFGGVDLVQRVDRRVALRAPIRGRLQDKSATDYANTIGQAFAVRGLAGTGSPKARAALRFLLKQQCRAGYFRLGFTPSKQRADQTCDGGNPRTTSAPDTDVTALALLSLDSLGSRRPPVVRAIAKAKSWLRSVQRRNGSFGGGTSTEASNANSTGLAGWALGEVSACGAAAAAADWLRGLQATITTGPLAPEQGAIAYDRAAYRTGRADGVVTETRDQWRRATAQAAPALGNLLVSDCRAR